MTQQTPDKNEAAEERTEDTRRFVRQVREATRRKYTSKEKIRIVLEGFRRELTVSELCRREGIKPDVRMCLVARDLLNGSVEGPEKRRNIQCDYPIHSVSENV